MTYLNNVAFLTSEQARSEDSIGSTLIRATWPMRYWPEAEEFVIGRSYSGVIFQKAYWVEYARQYSGTKILDLCDPDFFDSHSRCIEMADLCDFITTSTQPLADLISRYTATPAICIRDRLDLTEFADYRKSHLARGDAKVAAWFGYSANFAALDISLQSLIRVGIEQLIVIASNELPYKLPPQLVDSLQLVNYPWSRKTAYGHLLEADIVVNFTLPYGRWRMKSNNKTVLAWALGLPVAHSETELRSLISESDRIRETTKRLMEVERDYNVKDSVAEYQSLFYRIRGNRAAIR